MATISADAMYWLGYMAHGYYAQLVREKEFFGTARWETEVALIPKPVSKTQIRVCIAVRSLYRDGFTYQELDTIEADEIAAYITEVKAAFARHYHQEVFVQYRPELEEQLR